MPETMGGFKKDKGLVYIDCPLCGSNDLVLEKQVFGWNIVKCERCGFCYNNPRLSQSEISSIYSDREDIPSYYQESYALELFYRKKLDIIENYVPKGRLLDFGCGSGLFLELAKERGYEVYGLDLSQGVAKIAEKRGFEPLIGSIHELTLPNNYFDIIFSSATLEHLYSPLDDLIQINQILKRGGLLLLTSIPNFHSITIKLGLQDFRGNDPPGHLNYFSLKTLRKLLRKSGFNIIKSYTYGVDYQGISVKIAKHFSENTKDFMEKNQKERGGIKKKPRQKIMENVINLYCKPIGTLGDKLEVIASSNDIPFTNREKNEKRYR